MPTFTLGQAAYVNKGTYNASTAYAPLNTCYYQGGTWVALQNVTGVAPGTDSTKWLCITCGIKTITLSPGNVGYVNMTVTLTDGSAASTSFPVTGVGDGTITVEKLSSDFVLPVGKGGTGNTNGAQAPIQVFNGTLSSGGWDANTKTQSLTITNMTSASQFIAQPNNKAGWIAAQGATLYPPTAGTNTLTFECANIPSADISITVYWW